MLRFQDLEICYGTYMHWGKYGYLCNVLFLTTDDCLHCLGCTCVCCLWLMSLFRAAFRISSRGGGEGGKPQIVHLRYTII